MSERIVLGEPVNAAERQVVELLEAKLPVDFSVLSGFWVPQGPRMYECDCLVASPEGWAYLIEVKGWTGAIRGNDREWEYRTLSGGTEYRPNPVELTNRKAQVIKSVAQSSEALLRNCFVEPIVVLVSDQEPQLAGSWSSKVVMLGHLIESVSSAPAAWRRPSVNISGDLGGRLVGTLAESARKLKPERRLGEWNLEEMVEAGPTWEVWTAKAATSGSEVIRRLKKYDIQAYAGKGEAGARRITRDLESLERLGGAAHSVPDFVLSGQTDDSLWVVTPWPSGESLSSILARGKTSVESAATLVEAIAEAVAQIHDLGVIHRNLTPECLYVSAEGAVTVTDFDFARLPGVSVGVTRLLGEELSGDWRAPEVRLDPGAATEQSDVWSIGRVGAALLGVADSSGEFRWRTVDERMRAVLQRCLAEDPAQRYADARTMFEDMVGSSSLPAGFDGFCRDDTLQGRYVVESRITSGGISVVYQVWDCQTEKEFAAKFVRSEFSDRIEVREEYRLLENLPRHPGLVFPTFVADMQSFERSGRTYDYKANFLLSPWIEGDGLDALIGERLSATRVVEIALELAAAVGHLHSNQIVHRDVKPENVVVDRDGRIHVLDFNVSASEDSSLKTQVGTSPYVPPGQLEWSPASDVYAICCILCELLSSERVALSVGATPGALAGGGAKFLAAAQARSDSASLLSVLGRGLGVSGESIDDALGLQDALSNLDLRVAKTMDEPPEMTGDGAANPYRRAIASMFSQSSLTNAASRGLDVFSRWLYVETELDALLYESATTNPRALVLVTGNAGDGKTALLQRLEERLRFEGAIHHPRGRNGSELLHGGRRILTNWDGSQDEGDEDSDSVLRELLGAWAGAAPSGPERETVVVAINEGRLLDFVIKNREEYPWLADLVQHSLGFSDEPVTSESVVVVNLNYRVLTLGSGFDSVVGKLLMRVADPGLWRDCKGCPAHGRCYARLNALELQDPVMGDRLAERIRLLLDTVRMRRQLHITMRDLRSVLAFAVVGDRGCEEIVSLEAEGSTSSLLSGRLFNSLFAASGYLHRPFLDKAAAKDRLMVQIAALDPARQSNPVLDRGLAYPQFVPPPEEQPVWSTLDEALEQELMSVPANQVSRAGSAGEVARATHATRRRKAFLEMESSSWPLMLPYRDYDRFAQVLESPTEEDLSFVLRAVSRTDGQIVTAAAPGMVVRAVSSEQSGAGGTFLHFEPSDFSLSSVTVPRSGLHVDSKPEAIVLRYLPVPTVALEIGLDLFEFLSRCMAGNRPSREQMRGAWLDLQVFKDMLSRQPSTSLNLVDQNGFVGSIVRSDGGRALVLEVGVR